MSQPPNPPNANIVITPLAELAGNGRVPTRDNLPRPIIFLSGTTNFNGDETRWQQALIDSLFAPSSSTATSDGNTMAPSSPIPPLPLHPLTIIDPYNPTWDSTWSEDPADSKFVAQVDFEVRGLAIADIVVVGFLGREAREGIRGVGATSLMELGLGLGGWGMGRGWSEQVLIRFTWKRETCSWTGEKKLNSLVAQDCIIRV
ncbi:hypothetical protein EYC84_000449 [Monilinia fructicola]|uniref:Uncharacterized protein n=1 Tax=Monilinia fructicola TaxID=38448 RepID=A0A5M9JWB4_MONFR|nr:hypothetical protein EYC84_000449 [Monilinia fructicola]